MIFNIFKTLLCAFLIFLSCFIADVGGKSITELEEKNTAEFDSQELSSKAFQETTSEESVLVSSAGPCDPNPCENGGSCITRIDYVEGFVCDCPVGFAGKNCEIDRCSLLQCSENEICVVENGDIICKLQVDLCSEVCGENPGVVCEGGKTKSDAITCSCKDEDKMFDEGEKECKVKEVDLCSEICGENPGVMCEGDETNRDNITCSCKDKGKIFDQEAKECKVEKVDLCLEVCGEDPGVICEGDETNRDNITCSCKDKDKIFDQEAKECKVEKVDLCSEICGENPGVMCEGDETNRDNITCSCTDKDKIFDQEAKECKVEKDTNTCFFRNWYVSWETAVKLCADENSTLLCYKTRKEMKDILESFRLTTIDNAKFSVWLGNRNCTREKGEMEKCLSLHIQKSDKTEWHYFQTDCEEANPFVCCVDGTNECDRVKCQNGGICNIIDGKAVCDCPIGYTGDLCEKHPCTNDPCLNGGQCIVTGTAFNCICKESYFGKFCETNLCDQYICRNGGTCKVIREQPKCFCKEPYSGKFCDIRMDDCLTNFCENGGICRTMNGEPKCFCTEPYGGKFCNTRTDLRYNFTVFAVVYMLLGLVLISIGLLISCLLCRRICFGRK